MVILSKLILENGFVPTYQTVGEELYQLKNHEMGAEKYTIKEAFNKIALDKGYENPMDYFKTLTKST